MSGTIDLSSFIEEPRPFPYSDYKIIGDIAEVEKVRVELGHINISESDIKSTLSKGSVSYVSTGYGSGEEAIADALKAATDNLPVSVDTVASMIIQLWHPREDMSIGKIIPLTEYVKNLPSSIDVCWGCAFSDENDDIKITLIASSI